MPLSIEVLLGSHEKGVALPSDRCWVPVIYPNGPKVHSGWQLGKGQPPMAFISLSCLKALPKEVRRVF